MFPQRAVGCKKKKQKPYKIEHGIVVFVSTHAAWEIISELFTITRDARFYHKCYEEVTIIPRTIFWFITAALTLIGWIIVLP